MTCLQTWAKQHLGEDLFGLQTEFDLDLCTTLTVKVKLLNSANIVIILLVMDRFD